MRRLFRPLVLLCVGALVFGILVTGISLVQGRMNEIRVREKLTEVAPAENAPPMVVFTTQALGGFRGLLADWLWLRSGRMQDAGNYFEMVQLASWIVKLQPRFTGATAFLAWNMSYNISVTFNSFEDRWRWVQRGIELIRDEALIYNPGDPELFRELGWIYQHKMGRDLDDANQYYKTEMAREMIAVFGPDYPPDWDALAGAARTEEALREQFGGDMQLWRILERNGMTFETFEEEFRRLGRFPDELEAPLRTAGVARALELCLRQRWLTQVYKLDPARIRQVNEKYGGGELDFRLPEAHAIYWASRGLEAAERGDELSLTCDRMIFQSLTAAFKTGRLVYVKGIEHLEMTANIGLVDVVDKAYREALERHGDETIRGAYGNFLVDATVMLYTFGQESKARQYYRRGVEFQGRGRYSQPLDEFVLKELGEDMVLASRPQAQMAIQAYVLQSCRALAVGDYDRAAAFEVIAGRLYQKYQKFVAGTEERRGLPPYPQMKRNAVERALALFPPGLRDRLRIELEGQTGELEPDPALEKRAAAAD